MCGRFDFDTEKSTELSSMTTSLSGHLNAGEIFPTDRVPVLVDSPHVRYLPMYWGFPQGRGSSVIINARSETVLEKPMFRDCILNRRCVICSTGFYEWNKYHTAGERPKYKFTLPDSPVLYMAAIFRSFPELGEENPRFTILTTSANQWVEELHHRMPVVLRPEELEQWLHGSNFSQLFERSKLALRREQVGFPAQLSFFEP